MTDLLCVECKRNKFEDSESLNQYLDNIQEKINNNTYKKIFSDNIDLNNFEEILNYYNKINNEKYIYYLVKVTFNISFDNDNDNHDLITTYEHNTEIYKLNMQFKYFIDFMKSEGKNFNKINQMTIYILGDNCNMTDEYSRYMRFSSIERKINQLSSKYQLLNQVSNNILIKNKSHIIFNI